MTQGLLLLVILTNFILGVSELRELWFAIVGFAIVIKTTSTVLQSEMSWISWDYGAIRDSLLNDFEFSRQCLHKDTKYTFKTSKMDQITLECWYNSLLWLLRADGREFLHQKQILKKVRQTRNQDAAHAQKRVTVPLSIRADWSRIGVEKKLENILDGSLTNLSSSVKWISYCEWLAPKLTIRK